MIAWLKIQIDYFYRSSNKLENIYILNFINTSVLKRKKKKFFLSFWRLYWKNIYICEKKKKLWVIEIELIFFFFSKLNEFRRIDDISSNVLDSKWPQIIYIKKKRKEINLFFYKWFLWFYLYTYDLYVYILQLSIYNQLWILNFNQLPFFFFFWQYRFLI